MHSVEAGVFYFTVTIINNINKINTVNKTIDTIYFMLYNIYIIIINKNICMIIKKEFLI